MEYRLPRNKYPESESQWETHRRILEEVRRLPGVASAALVSGLPFSGNGSTLELEIVGGAAERQGFRARALTVSDGYFETLGIRLLAGRTLAATDRADAPPVVVVSQSLAERHFAARGPLGERLAIVDDGERFEVEIVGVVADTKQYGLDEEELPAVYGAQAQNPGIFDTLAVRTAGDPMRLAGAVRAAVWAVDAEQPVWKVRTLESLVDSSVGLPRFLARLMSVYAGVALLLAAIGIYGVVATLVSQRRGEIGLRLALGAQRRDVLRLVLSHGMRWSLVGVVAGIAASLALGRFLRALLYRTDATDPTTLATIAALVAGVTLVACYLPARTAVAIDPARTLRAE
jgi:putative ABC transport system permease protein